MAKGDNMEERIENEKSISLSEIWLVARANIVWVLLIVFLSAAIGAAYAYLFKKTTYVATIDVVVQALNDTNIDKEENKFTITTAYQYSALLAPDYEKVMKSHEVINRVNENKPQALYKMSSGALSFKYTEESPYFSIKYTYSVHGGNTSNIKIAVADTLNNYVKECQQILHENENGNYLYLADNLVVTSSANQSNVSVNTGIFTTILLAVVIGIVLAFALVLLIYFVDDRISKREDAERISGVSVLTFIDISTNATLENAYINKGGETDAIW